MNQHESNKLNMFISTEGVLNANQDKVSTVKALADATVELGADIQNIKAKDVTFEEKSTPKGIVKTEAREALIVTVIHIAGGIFTYADVNKNAELKQQVDLTDSDIHNMSDTELETKSENIYKLASANSASLTDYGVLAEDIAALRTETDAFVLAKKNIGTGSADRSGTRSSLTEYFAAASALLENRIDKLMNGFKKKAPEFFKSYWAARNIWDKGGSHTKDTPTANTTAANTASSGTATASGAK